MGNLHISNPVITPSGEWLWCPWTRQNGSVPINGITIDDLSGATVTIDGVTSSLTNYAVNNTLGGILFPLGKPRTVWGRNEDDSGYSSSGTWTTRTPTGSTGGFFGTTDASGASYRESVDPTATWTWPTITGMSSGKHRLYGHIWGLVGPGRTTNAVYTVKNGSGVTIATFVRNLVPALYPQFDKCISGYILHFLGEFTLGAGQTSATITLSNGAGTGVMFSDALFVESHFDPPVHPGQAITVSIPAGAAHDVFDGPLTAVVNMPVGFSTDATFFGTIQPANLRTIKVGYNFQGIYENWPNNYLADRSDACDMWKGPVTLDQHFVMTANTGTASRELMTTSDLSGDQGLSSWGMRLLPDGIQRFEFTVSGATFDATARSNVNIVNRDGGQQWVIGSKTWTDLGSNRWRVEIPIAHPTWQPISTRSANFNPAWSQGLRFEAATPGVVYTQWRWYDSGVPIGYTGITHPHIVNTYKDKVKVLRGMDSLGTNFSPASEITHYSSPTDQATPLTPGTGPGFKFAQANLLAAHPVNFDPVTDPDHFNRYFDLNAYYCWMTVDLDVDPVAAGFGDGTQVQWQSGATLNTTVAGFVSNFASDMLTFKIPGNRLLLACLVDHPGVTDHYDTTGNVRATITTTYTPGSPIPIWVRKNHAMSPETFLNVCAEINAEPWINFAHACSDNYIRAMMQKIIARTPDGRVINGEYSNETWNSAFGQYHYFPAMAHYTNWLHAQDPTANPITVVDWKKWIVHRALQIRSICRNELTLAGRNPALFRINLDSVTQAPSETDDIIFQVQAEGQILDQRDCVAIEGYQDANPPGGGWSGPDLNATWSRTSVDGFIDLLAATTFYGSRSLLAGQHRSKLNAAGFTACGLSGYETGWAYVAPNGDPRYVADIMASPRLFRLTAAEQAELQDCGYSISNKYADIYYSNIGNNVYWTDFTSVNQGLGTGNPAENPCAVDYANVVSQTAGGRLAFSAGFDFDAVVTSTTSNPTIFASVLIR